MNQKSYFTPVIDQRNTKGMQIMNRPSNPGTGTRPDQENMALQRWRSNLTISFFVLGAGFLILAILTIGLCMLSTTTRNDVLNVLNYLSQDDNPLRFLTHLTWLLATIVFIGLFVVFASLLYILKSPLRHDKVIDALHYTLDYDEDPKTRIEAAKGLAHLDVEMARLHQEHDKIDDILVSKLEGQEHDHTVVKQPSSDHDARVRTEVAKGLANLESEEHSYFHRHNKLDDMLFEPDQ
jgi:hypothetical protein